MLIINGVKPKWQWSNDGKTATVVFTCENDRTHKATPKVTMTSVVKIPATCTKMGLVLIQQQ